MVHGEVSRSVGVALVARTPVTVLAMPGAEHAGAEAPGPRAVEGVVPAAVGLPSVLGAATTSAAGDDTTDRAQLHPRIVGELAGAVYSPAVLRRGDQSVPHNRQCGGDVAPTLLAAASPARDGSRRRSWGSTLPLWPGVTRRQWTSVPARKTLMPRSVATEIHYPDASDSRSASSRSDTTSAEMPVVMSTMVRDDHGLRRDSSRLRPTTMRPPSSAASARPTAGPASIRRQGGRR